MSRHFPVHVATIVGACLLATSVLGHAASGTAVPPATFVGPAVEKAVAVPAPLITGPRHTIRLSAPTDAELKSLAVPAPSAKRGNAKAAARAIGLPRELDAAARTIDPAKLTWSVLGDGTRAARIDVTSSGAAGVRLALVMPEADPDIVLRFAGSAHPDQVFGPVPANQVAEIAATDGAFWTPVLEGDTASIEIDVPADVPLGSVTLSIVRLSHLVIAGSALRDPHVKTVADIGTSAACEVDLACVDTAATTQTAKSVAQLVFTKADGRTLQCTGTLLNDSSASFTPYLYTANHCIGSQAAASTLNTYWFFDALACGSKAVPPYVLLTGGATLLGRSEDYDWSLVRMRDSPPSGAVFSAWRAEVVPAGTPGGTAHHPEGDLKKWTQGITTGYFTYPDKSTFIEVLWTIGSTEPGSSGAGLFILQSAGGFYELRGGLFAGEASCRNASGTDRFSRLDKALPVLRQYLTPTIASPNAEVVVVEFYNKQLDHYFITSNPAEINDLDTGVHPGWERTGLRFLAYSDPARAPAGATPVCRFYLNPQFGDSHFYSGDPAECAATQARFGASWTFESPSVFWIVLPDRTTGACPTGLNPVYRFFNTLRTNHRYTMEEDIRFDLSLTSGWIPEGYGPDAVIMCSPAD